MPYADMYQASVAGHASPDGETHMQALCRFTGRACLLCDRMDVNAICQYVADTLKQAETHDLLMLMSIIKKMTVSHL